jgi:hypothetical protein
MERGGFVKRYMTGAVTGALVGAVLAGYWLLNRAPKRSARNLFQPVARWGPSAYRVARRSGRRLIGVARGRVG